LKAADCASAVSGESAPATAMGMKKDTRRSLLKNIHTPLRANAGSDTPKILEENAAHNKMHFISKIPTNTNPHLAGVSHEHSTLTILI
jgi:hypothetical protein